jgi:hypothetical protein
MSSNHGGIYRVVEIKFAIIRNFFVFFGAQTVKNG